MKGNSSKLPILLLFFLVISCTPNHPIDDSQTSLSVSPYDVVLNVGEQIRLTVKSSIPSSFTSMNPSIASVSKDGTVTGIKKGNTTIKIIAGKSIAECKVTVIDKETDENSFRTILEEATASSITFSVKPTNREINYYTSVDNKENCDKRFSSEKDFIDNKITYLKTMATVHKMDFSEYLNTVLKKGENTICEDNLYSDTDYYINIFGIDSAGKITTTLYRIEARTTSFEPANNLSFSLRVLDQDKNKVSIEITPSRNDCSYFFGHFTEEDYSKYSKPEDAISDIIFNANIFDEANFWENPSNTFQGKRIVTIEDLENEKNYVLIVFGINSQGQQTSNAGIIKFRTKDNEVQEKIHECPLPFGSSKDAVEKFEKSEGSIYDENLSGIQGLEYMSVYRVSKSPIVMRIYFISENGNGGINEYWAVQSNYDEIFNKDGSLTEDFIACLQSSGYAPPFTNEEGAILTYKENMYDLMISPATGEDLSTDSSQLAVLCFTPRGELVPRNK